MVPFKIFFFFQNFIFCYQYAVAFRIFLKGTMKTSAQIHPFVLSIILFNRFFRSFFAVRLTKIIAMTYNSKE